MSTGRRIAVGALLALLAASLLWLARLEGRVASSRVSTPESAPTPAELMGGPQGGRRSLLDEPGAGSADALEAASGARGWILGFVVDSRGFPVPGAALRLEPGARPGIADSAGRFELHDLSPGAYTLEVLAEGLTPPLVPPRAAGAASPTAVEIPAAGGMVRTALVVANTATVQGRVEGPDGDPVRGASARARSLGSVRNQVLAATDELGRFTLAGVWPGDFELQVFAPSDSSLGRLPRPVRTSFAAPGEDLDLGVLVFQHGSRSVRGLVVDQRGAPVTGIAIACSGGTVATDEEGRFRFDGLPAKRLSLWIAHPSIRGYRRVFANPNWWVTAEADLTTESDLDLGTIPIETDPLARVIGHLNAESSPFPLAVLQVTVEYPTRLPVTFLDAAGRTVVDESVEPGLPGEHVHYDPESGTFTLTCLPLPEDGPGGLPLLFTVRHAGTQLARVPVSVLPEETRTLHVPLR